MFKCVHTPYEPIYFLSIEQFDYRSLASDCVISIGTHARMSIKFKVNFMINYLLHSLIMFNGRQLNPELIRSDDTFHETHIETV